MEGEFKRRFLSVKELSEYIGIKEPTIRDWIRFAKIPYLKLGKCVRFDVGEINEWLNAKKVVLQ